MQQDIPCEKQSSPVKMELSEGKSDTALHQHKQGRQHWEEVFQFSCLRQKYLAIFRHTLYMNPLIIPLTQIDFKCLQGRTPLTADCMQRLCMCWHPGSAVSVVICSQPQLWQHTATNKSTCIQASLENLQGWRSHHL